MFKDLKTNIETLKKQKERLEKVITMQATNIKQEKAIKKCKEALNKINKLLKALGE